jgi:ribosome-binding protein aMBF1 (putative translation factor)
MDGAAPSGGTAAAPSPLSEESEGAVEAPLRPRRVPLRDLPAPRRRAGGRRGRHWAVGDRLRRARAAAKLTIRALAEQTRTSPSTILCTERGTSLPRGQTIRRLAEVLGISTDWLLTGRETAHPPEGECR